MAFWTASRLVPMCEMHADLFDIIPIGLAILAVVPQRDRENVCRPGGGSSAQVAMDDQKGRDAPRWSRARPCPAREV